MSRDRDVTQRDKQAGRILCSYEKLAFWAEHFHYFKLITPYFLPNVLQNIDSLKQVTDLHQILGHEDVTSRGIVPVYWSASQLLSKLDKPIRSQYGGSVTNERHGTRNHSQPIRSKHGGTVIKERSESGSAVSYDHSQPIKSQYLCHVITLKHPWILNIWVIDKCPDLCLRSTLWC